MPRFNARSRNHSTVKKSSTARKPSTTSHIKIGDTLEAEVSNVATHGKAVVRLSSGLAVFVAGAWLGETIKLKITALKKNYGEAELLSVESASPQRVTPPCQHFSSVPACGGCAWQFIDYSAQLAVKQQWVQRAFSPMLPSKARSNTNIIANVAPSPSPWAYRNRAEFKSHGQALGFLSTHSHALIDITDCPVLTPTMQAHLSTLRQQLPSREWHKKPPAKHPKKHKTKNPYHLIAVDESMPLGEYRFNTRLDFQQGNSAQNMTMKAWLADALRHRIAHKVVLELFAGAGNFTCELLALLPAKLIAAEVAESAVAHLNALAEGQSAVAFTAVAADLFDQEKLQRLCAEASDAECLVLDPPREGLVCIEPLLGLPKLKNIAYISCDLATCARDVGRFVAAGYTVEQVQPIDMFPQTPHLELCVLLTR